jgi:hypothetical protein
MYHVYLRKGGYGKSDHAFVPGHLEQVEVGETTPTTMTTTFPTPVCDVGHRCLRVHPNSPVIVVAVGLHLVPLGPAAGALWE